VLLLEQPRAAIRVRRAMPSNIWWKVMTAERLRRKVSPATTRVRLITRWINF